MSIIRLDLCSQLTQKHLDSLRSKNLLKTTEFISQDAEEISQTTGIPYKDVVAIRNVILAKYGAVPVLGSDLYTSVLTSTAILSTGIDGVDKLLDGGLYTGEVTEVVGNVSSGKTQLCFHACVSTALQNNQGVMYIDTGGVFSAGRLADITEAKGHKSKVNDVLNRIHCCQAYTIEDVFTILMEVKAGILGDNSSLYTALKLVILDNVASVVYPFLGGGSFSENQGLLSSLGHHLRMLAVECSVAVLVTNNLVTGQDGSMSASLGRAWSHVPHVRFMICDSIEESREERRTLRVLKSSRGPSKSEGEWERTNGQVT